MTIDRHSLTRRLMKVLNSVGVRSLTLHLASGPRIRVRTRDILAARIANEKWFEPAVREALTRHVTAGMTVLDIGANIGYYTVSAGRLVGVNGKVLSFEPQPSVQSGLLDNIRLNNLQNVVVLPFALWSSNQEVEFMLPHLGEEAMGAMRENGRFAVRGRIRVPAKTLDATLSELGIDRVDFIKMDAEGAELAIIHGARDLLTSPHKPVIVFEACEANCEPFGYSVFQLLETIASFGYVLTQLDDSNWLARPVTVPQPGIAAGSAIEAQ